MIDTISPFFIKSKKKKINWSKIPFSHIEKQGVLTEKTIEKIVKAFTKFIGSIKTMGYNSVSMDELCYMISFDFYSEELKAKLETYNKLYNRLFRILEKENLDVYVTTDIMFYNDEINRVIESGEKSEFELFEESVKKLFTDYPYVRGLITRIGESDGLDTKGDFRSRLYLKTAEESNNFIKTLVPYFESMNKYLIFRTWTVGAYEIGDLMWNEETYNRCFDGVESDNFIISMKFGDSDYFRYLKLNKHFFIDNKKKIIELQTRREYEGFGEYPSFTGYDYERYYKELKNNESLAGITVWCQTGGWSTFKNFTFLKNSSYWNEVNTYSAIKIFEFGQSAEDSIIGFDENIDSTKLIEFLRLSDEVVKEILYDPNYSENEYYFNKVRIPTLLHIFWNNVTLTNFTLMFYKIFCTNHEDSIEKAYTALGKIIRMKEIAEEAGIENYNYEFHYDTFYLLAKMREIIYSDVKKDDIKEFKHLAKEYKDKYPNTYRFYTKISIKKNYFLTSVLIKLLVRKKREYRFIDKVLFNKITSKFYIYLYQIAKKRFPKFLDSQAMPVETLFK